MIKTKQPQPQNSTANPKKSIIKESGISAQDKEVFDGLESKILKRFKKLDGKKENEVVNLRLGDKRASEISSSSQLSQLRTKYSCRKSNDTRDCSQIKSNKKLPLQIPFSKATKELKDLKEKGNPTGKTTDILLALRNEVIDKVARAKNSSCNKILKVSNDEAFEKENEQSKGNTTAKKSMKSQKNLESIRKMIDLKSQKAEAMNIFTVSAVETQASSSDENFEITDHNNPIELSKDDLKTYGDREPYGYKRIKLLGKGGCGIVWLCRGTNGVEYALKQVSKKILGFKNEINSNIAIKEIEIIKFLMDKSPNGLEPELMQLVDHVDDSNDIWLILNKGGKSLSSLTYKLKGEFLNSERIYKINKGRFLNQLFENTKLFKELLRRLLRFISFTSANNIVHSDLKPDNILINYGVKTNGEIYIRDLKVVDYGSAFFINNPENFNSNTPEYMSPEICELIEKNASNKDVTSFLSTLNPWAIDIWSIGITIIELLLLCPLWLNYKCKIIKEGKAEFTTGYFGVKGRAGNKIYSKQIDLPNHIERIVFSSLMKDKGLCEGLTDLLKRMLTLNYKTRISPREALDHRFFK